MSIRDEVETHNQLRAKQLRARHRLLIGESGMLQATILMLTKLRDEKDQDARECFDEAERIDPTPVPRPPRGWL